MSVMSALLAVVTIGIVTYGSRAGLILFLADRHLPSELERALRYVGPAVLAALVVTLVAGGEGRSGIDGAEVTSLAVAVGVAVGTKNLVLALASGMAVLWLVLWLT